MKEHDVIIIGAGLGGLTAGARLAKEGKRVCLIEQHYIPGGCATTFRRNDFTMEVGLHSIDGLDEDDMKAEIFEELGVFDHVEFVSIPEFYRFIHGKTDIVVPDNREQAIRVLSEHFPHERKNIRKFFRKIFALRREVHRLPADRWRMLALLPVFPFLFPNLLFGSRRNLGDFLDRTIKDEELKLILQANLPYYHDDPYSMSLVYFSVAQASFFSGGGHFIKGGSGQLSNHLASVITDNGGEILLGHKVERIIIEDNRATGVEYGKAHDEDGSTDRRFADTIIANAAIPNVLAMLPPKQQGQIAEKAGKLQISCSILSVYLGFGSDIRKLGSRNHSTFVFSENTRQLRDIGPGSNLDRFVFVDYSQIDSGLAPKGKSFAVISVVDYMKNWDDLSDADYKAKKEEIASVLIRKLEETFPGIGNEIECLEVATPRTIRRYTLNPEGTAYGYAQTPQQAGMNRLPNKSPISNLYFASAWANPGGGFTGAILGGWFCANEILRN
ncbi:MAG: hypothetical protein CSB44_06910 [Gammaproteobacteria bacterium]|nr:MAG: hypothetical protein CSB44_06910 [Gammaproteobacteria bacterium]